MRIVAAITGDLRRVVARENAAAIAAVTDGVRETTAALKETYRRQITAAGMGQRFANTWRGEVYPKGRQSISAAGVVYSRAPLVVSAHAEGATIKARGHRFLAIPLPAAGKINRKRPTVEDWEKRAGRKLRFIPRKQGGGLLVLDEGRLTSRGIARGASNRARAKGQTTTIPLFVLVPQVQLRKRLDIAGPAKDAGARLPAAVVAKWRAAGGE